MREEMERGVTQQNSTKDFWQKEINKEEGIEERKKERNQRLKTIDALSKAGFHLMYMPGRHMYLPQSYIQTHVCIQTSCYIYIYIYIYIYRAM